MEEDFQIEFMSLPLEDLQDHYGKLFERYRQMRDDAEADTQRIHELKRNLETAYAAENYLSQEIEELMQTLASIEKDNKGQTLMHTELEDLRRQHHTLTTDYTTLQQDYATLSAENVEMRKQLETVKSARRLSTSSIVDAGTEELTNRIATLEGENFSLMQKLEEFQESIVRQTLALAEKESNIEVLRDQVTCLEGNLRSKREDLDEKTTLLESTQEHLAEANAKLAMLETKPEGVGRKGNSLFAEVDDQRQAMKKLLAAQKKSYIDMKRMCNDSQSEIRRLKRENIAMHTELKECTTIFCSADRTYQDKLNDRIRQLLGQVEGLEKQLKLSQSRLSDLAKEKGVEWFDSMLSYCKNETDELKKQLHSVRIQKASVEEQLRNVQQEMTRWRFEALKTRCVLLDREDILTERGIEFKPIRAVEFNIDKKEQESARPLIVDASPGTPPYKAPKERMSHILSTPLGQKNTPNGNTLEIYNTPSRIISVKQEQEEKENQSDFTLSNDESIGPPQKQQKSTILVKTEPCFDNTFDQVTNSLANEMQMVPSKNCKRQPPALDAHPGPSILSKKGDIFTTDEHNQKNVQFSAQDPTVHNISANVSMGSEGTIDGMKKEDNPKVFFKEIRKANVIIRHIVMPSKRKPQ